MPCSFHLKRDFLVTPLPSLREKTISSELRVVYVAILALLAAVLRVVAVAHLVLALGLAVDVLHGEQDALQPIVSLKVPNKIALWV